MSPSTIHAAPGAEFSLSAVAKGYLGIPVTVPRGSDLTIEWLSPSGVVQDPAANPAIVHVPESPGTSFTLQAQVTGTNMLPECSPSSTVISSNTVTVQVTPPSASEAGGTGTSDWIEVEHIPGNPPAALLVQAAQGTAEVADWSLGIVGSARLGWNFEPAMPASGAGVTAAVGTTPATNELAIFAKDRSMELWPPNGPPACRTNPTTCPWTPGEDHLMANPMQLAGSRLLPIVWAVPDAGASEGGVSITEWTQGQVGDAQKRFHQTRAGLDLAWMGIIPQTLRDPETDQPAPVESPFAVCERIDDYIAPYSVREPTEIPADEEPPSDPRVLYVLFVPEILIPPSTDGSAATRLTGYACPPDESPDRPWVGRVVLISRADYNITTLVHEIGHVLSLNGDLTGTAGGHTNGLPGFDRTNIMNNTTSLPYRQARSHLTLGQIYRMNAHPKSWLNTMIPADQRIVRPCAPSTSRGVCPSLSADLGG